LRRFAGYFAPLGGAEALRASIPALPAPEAASYGLRTFLLCFRFVGRIADDGGSKAVQIGRLLGLLGHD
jgi:hypothetical protein